MLSFYWIELRKNWLVGIAPHVILGCFAILLISIWPEFKEYMAEMKDLLDSPIYQAILSSGALGLGIDTFEGFFSMEMSIFFVLFIIGIGVAQGTTIVTREIDRQTIDIVLSMPIPRWQLLLEKFAVVNTYTLFFPLVMGISTTLGVLLFGIKTDLIAFWTAYVLTWLVFYAAIALSLLCSTIFLKPGRSLMASTGILVIFLIMDRLGSMVKSVRWIKDYSLFSYLEFSNILNEVKNNNTIPYFEILLVFFFGTFCLLAALMIFQKREITY